MKLALSTNWCNTTIDDGAEIVEKAMSLGFEALELGFNTTETQAAQIVKCGKLPIGSVHAFCPVPISAPHGYPELYTLASFDEECRAMARFQIRKNIQFAASVGARALVLHAGRIKRTGLFKKMRVAKMQDILQRELDLLRPILEENRVVLGLENMPYPEGFPNEAEYAGLLGEWIRLWYDTGHAHVMGFDLMKSGLQPIGMHINDSLGGDDHLPPGEGEVDFNALAPAIKAASHIVFEPQAGLPEERLVAGREFFLKLIAESI